MKGHLRERGRGRWAIVLDISSNPRKQRWFSFTGTKRQAQIRCAELIAELQSGGGIDPARTNLAAYFERWLEHMKGQVSPGTQERYCSLWRKSLCPLLGGLVLTKLQPAHISTAYAKALAAGRCDGKGGLSAQTVTHMHRVLREALQQALHWQLLARNPADAVKPPKIERKQLTVLDASATATLIEAARPYTVFMPVLLGALCGMRRGEITALRWRSVDLNAGQLAVVASTEQTEAGCREKETKSGRARTIALPALLIEELRRHRCEQAERLLRLGICATDDHHVIIQADGTPE